MMLLFLSLPLTEEDDEALRCIEFPVLFFFDLTPIIEKTFDFSIELRHR